MARGEEPVIGIDLGTMYSCVGVFQNGHVKIIASEHGDMKTPSCVAFTDTERLIGEAVKDQAGMNAANTVFSKCSCYFMSIFVRIELGQI